ncbi:MAG: YbgC/FadM family acyl-CoA thioesterase [Leptospiraceae bacterium]|nr:YbgC/FadM family acyl-CoA thioesterase [Leptospiraceae bacterium]MCP5494042.1 YbgC/FadM family acyl-CoA thioesterase [Leptospiraceae bacterium]
MEHRLDVKVYYEDTDCLGMVYYANYLKYMERGRSEFISQIQPIHELNSQGYNFAVYEMKIKYLKIAKLGDMLVVVTKLSDDKSEFRRKFLQRVELNGIAIVEAEVDIICLNAEKQLRAIPVSIF